MKDKHTKSSKVKPENLLKDFAEGKNTFLHFNLELGVKIINVEFPIWSIRLIDKEAKRRNVARQALIRMWIIDRLDAMEKKEP